MMVFKRIHKTMRDWFTLLSAEHTLQVRGQYLGMLIFVTLLMFVCIALLNRLILPALGRAPMFAGFPLRALITMLIMLMAAWLARRGRIKPASWLFLGLSVIMVSWLLPLAILDQATILYCAADCSGQLPDRTCRRVAHRAPLHCLLYAGLPGRRYSSRRPDSI
jgi:hypothetical protein